MPENTKKEPCIDPQIIELASDMAVLRRIFHQRPETAFEEDYAHGIITDLLNEWDLPYETMAGTGVVVTLEGRQNTSGKVVALRADMDALNVEDKSGVPWESRNKGKMHACGHDGHMATMLTALAYLKDNPEFNGTVKIIFQPAEEGMGGAKRIIEEGLLERHKLDTMYGFHNWPSLPFGKAAIHPGPVMASNINYEIILRGKGCHGAMPETGNNPIPASANLILELYSLSDAFTITHPDEKVVLSICASNAGDMGALNVIPDNAEIGGTVRVYNHEIKEAVPVLITQTAQSMAENYDMTAQVNFPNICSPTVNNKDKAKISREAMAKVIGDENIEWDAEPAMTAEDFGEFSRLIPVSYIWIGNADPENGQSPHSQPLHNPGYGFNDDIIPIGAQYFVNIIKEELPLTNYREPKYLPGLV